MRTWSVLAACALLMACETQKPAGTNVAPIVAPPPGAVGGAAAAGGVGAAPVGVGGTTAPAQPMPVACGTKTCEPGQSFGPIVPMPPCCANMASGQCGWLVGGTCTPPPPVDPDCPPFALTGQPGCCVEGQNKCGIDASRFGRGCFDLAMLMGPMPPPPPVDCDGKPIAAGGAGGGAAGGATGGAGGMSGSAGASAGAGRAAGGSSGGGSSAAGSSAGGSSAGGSSAPRAGSGGSSTSGGAGGR